MNADGSGKTKMPAAEGKLLAEHKCAEACSSKQTNAGCWTEKYLEKKKDKTRLD